MIQIVHKSSDFTGKTAEIQHMIDSGFERDTAERALVHMMRYLVDHPELDVAQISVTAEVKATLMVVQPTKEPPPPVVDVYAVELKKLKKLKPAALKRLKKVGITKVGHIIGKLLLEDEESLSKVYMRDLFEIEYCLEHDLGLLFSFTVAVKEKVHPDEEGA